MFAVKKSNLREIINKTQSQEYNTKKIIIFNILRRCSGATA